MTNSRQLTRIRFILFLVLPLLCLTAHPGFAGWYYEATTSCQGSDPAKVSAMNHSTRSWLNGDKVKVEFITSQLPAIQSGSSMVSTDGGLSIHLVNPIHKNYYLMDLAAMRGMVGSMMQVHDPVIEKVVDERNGSLLGIPVRYVKFRTSYEVHIKVLGIKDVAKVASEQEIWVAENITDPGSTFWTGQSGYATGDEAFDKLMHAAFEEIKGLPLRQAMTIRSTDANGVVKETSSLMEVTLIREEMMDEAVFEIPDGFEETSFLKMQNPGGIESAEEQEAESAPKTDTGAVLEMMEKFNQPEDEPTPATP